MKRLEFKTFEQFVEYTNLYKNENNIRLFRGQKEDWPLESKLFRLVHEKNRINEFYKIEKTIFKEFKKQALNAIPIDIDNDWDILSIAQHYGLPTRLLDWSSDPLIALWFSFEEEKENKEDRIIWELNVRKEKFAVFKKDDPFTQHDRFIRVFEPIPVDPRIKSQKSWFSIQNIQVFRQGGGDGMPVFDEYNIINQIPELKYYLAKVVLPNRLRKDIMSKLDKLGVNYHSIYRDLTGICKNIEWKNLKNKAIYKIHYGK